MDNLGTSKTTLDINGGANNPGTTINTPNTDKKSNNLGTDIDILDIDDTNRESNVPSTNIDCNVMVTRPTNHMILARDHSHNQLT